MQDEVSEVIEIINFVLEDEGLLSNREQAVFERFISELSSATSVYDLIKVREDLELFLEDVSDGYVRSQIQDIISILNSLN